ncbi:MAG: hypothetical protein COB59_05925 [Rhodospirillaceae bacterium]|nr:MAG: hypothetical protein COB59_05925 [Rhodospirillaceae bacterium]
MNVKIGKKNSPRAPTKSLSDSIDRALQVYEKEGGKHPIPVETVAHHLGYKSSRSGAAVVTISALKSYGLLERPLDGHLAVSDELASYKFAPTEELRKKMLLKWLQSPPIFLELLNKFKARLPSDGTLKHTLIEMGFTPPKADACMAAFRKSVDFSGYYETPLGAPENEGSEADSFEQEAIAPKVVSREQPISPAVSSPPTPNDSERIPVRLTGGRRAWLEIPELFYSADKERLKAQIDLLLADDEE